MPTPGPCLATYLEPLTCSLLLSLGLDHALIDFLALGAVTVLLAILAVAIRIPRRQSAPSIPRIPE